ncbi:MAG: hypothetical protein COU22_00315 [Candidatus Komeilibacteria bacterium CG10_big_fil_rev_8_21_14_0_10_41_13]|uniref:Radical SAM core domain-containing protein n=1 Tax=Candidatus Komeilibacteria bacterium CG10_big_fil_rev_8_21_14_0_10_41_13 TaxID=1974476 RepID=A0A2M6WDB9_9BACT|nr:MAG: hypothetical protein COU22_00315 [Candidatus Komeilibacteria bacterium CG10_big_fil_rev_8_21_14_0_10_41_13]
MSKKIKNAFDLILNGQFDLLWFRFKRKLGFKDLVPPLPNVLIVEPANFCNLRCPLCPTGSGRLGREPRLMTYEEFKNIIGQVKGYVKKLFLFNYGEPLLNPDTPKMAKEAVEAGMKVKMSTNAMLLNSKELCVDLINSGLQHLIISLDGLDQETLCQYRVGSDLETVKKNIRLMVETKKEMKASTPKIELQFIVMKQNEHQKDDMANFAKEIGVDIFAAKTMFLYDTPEAQKMAERFVPSDILFSRYQKNDQGEYVLKGEITNTCGQVYETVAINSNGDVCPCCYDLFSRHVMGNVFKESLRSIWKNAKYQGLRNQIKKDRSAIHMCDICPENRLDFLRQEKQIS